MLLGGTPYAPLKGSQRARNGLVGSHSASPVQHNPAAKSRARILIRPEPGFYVMRLRPGAPVVPAVIYQLCPMVIPQPTTVTGPHPDEWCRPLDRSQRYEARIGRNRGDIDRVWTSRSLRAISGKEYRFRMRAIRRRTQLGDCAPEARPEKRVDLNRLPPLF